MPLPRATSRVGALARVVAPSPALRRRRTWSALQQVPARSSSLAAGRLAGSAAKGEVPAPRANAARPVFATQPRPRTAPDQQRNPWLRLGRGKQGSNDPSLGRHRGASACAHRARRRSRVRLRASCGEGCASRLRARNGRRRTAHDRCGRGPGPRLVRRSRTETGRLETVGTRTRVVVKNDRSCGHARGRRRPAPNGSSSLLRVDAFRRPVEARCAPRVLRGAGSRSRCDRRSLYRHSSHGQRLSGAQEAQHVCWRSPAPTASRRCDGLGGCASADRAPASKNRHCRSHSLVERR